MKTQKTRFRFNRRLLTETLCKYPTTFEAFCELINNAVQAGATEVDVTVDYVSEEKVSAVAFTFIEVRDNGCGVHKDDFEKKLLEVATDAKSGGQGIGRFAGLQIGKVIEIESCGKSTLGNAAATRTTTTLRKDVLVAGGNLAEQNIDIEFEEVAEPVTFFRIRISDLYSDSEVKEEKRRKLVAAFSEENFANTLFEKYAEHIFTSRLNLRINGKRIDPAEYLMAGPFTVASEFTAEDGTKHNLSYQLIQLKTVSTQHRIFLRQDNAGIKSVGHILSYEAAIPEPYQWFAYADSDYFDHRANVFRTIELLWESDPDSKKIHQLIQSDIDKFFAARYPVFGDFIKQLKVDTFYPYRLNPAPSETLEVVFQQVAFAVETKHKLLARGEKLRKLVYQLIDRCLNNGELDAVLLGIADLKPEVLAVFRDVMDKVEIEEVLKFSSQVASKLQILDFLFSLNYSEIAKHVKERSQLHKVVEKHLWLFGEEFNATPHLWSDKNLGNILDELRAKHFAYEPTVEDENLNEVPSAEIADITDLFFYSERVLSDSESEIVVVELKAPRVKLAAKELNQAERYALKIAGHAAIPSSLKFRILLVGSAAGEIITEKLGAIDPRRPSLVFQTKDKRIEVHAMTWSDLIDHNQRKLSCMGKRMKVNDRSVREVFQTDFSAVKIHAELDSQLRNADASTIKSVVVSSDSGPEASNGSRPARRKRSRKQVS